jgi:hypothetical protein
MADIAFFLGCAAILGISVVGTYIMVLLMDCLSRPAEHRRQLALQQQHKSDNEIRQQFLEALFPPKVSSKDDWSDFPDLFFEWNFQIFTPLILTLDPNKLPPRNMKQDKS